MDYTVKGTIRLSIHDLVCDSCGNVELDAAVDTSNIEPCLNPVERGEHFFHCLGKRSIRWDLSDHKSSVTIDPNIHPSERAAVYVHPHTGRVVYPGRVDVPMPDKYRQWGFEKKEFTTVRELDAFCKSKNLVNEKSNYNSGNGLN